MSSIRTLNISYNQFTLLIFLFLTLSFEYSMSQTRVDSLEYLGRYPTYNILQSRFDKQLNTYSLNTGFNIYSKFGEYDFRIFEDFKSSYIRGTESTIRDEQHLDLAFSRNFSKKFNLGVTANNSILSDNRLLGINQSSISAASLFTKYSPFERIIFAPFAGYANNRQIEENDYGLLYGLESEIEGIDLSDFKIDSELRFRNEEISPRRNLIRYYNLLLSNSFERGVMNSLNFRYGLNRKDFYFEADSITSSQFNVTNNIQSRIEDSYLLMDRFYFDQFLDVLSLDLSGLLNFRNIDRNTRSRSIDVQSASLFDTKIEELRLEFDATTRFFSDFFDGAFRINIAERDEKHQPKRFEGINETFFEERKEIEEQKNNNSTRTSLSMFGDFKFSKSDLLSLSLYHSKLKYDTPSNLNDDDRDEILSILRLRYSKKLSPFFTAFANLEGTYGHTVYIFAGRSSNNNVNRIIRLKTGGQFINSKFSSYNSFEVSSNYTVYDFEDLTSNFQSYSFRQFTAVDSSSLLLSKRLVLFAYGYIKLSEQGDFNWISFSERPTRYLQEIYIEPRFIFQLKKSSLSVGVRFFSLNTFNYDGNTKKLDTEYTSIGPIAVINLNLWNNLSLLFNGFYEFITANENNRQQANLISQLSWKF